MLRIIRIDLREEQQKKLLEKYVGNEILKGHGNSAEKNKKNIIQREQNN